MPAELVASVIVLFALGSISLRLPEKIQQVAIKFIRLPMARRFVTTRAYLLMLRVTGLVFILAGIGLIVVFFASE